MSKRKNRENKKHAKQSDGKAPVSSRRNFIYTVWKGLGVVAGLELAGLTFQYLTGRASGSGEDVKFTAGQVEEFPVNSVTAFRGERFYLARMKDGGFLALSLKCTHLGCSIIWDENDGKFVCPCHSSHFGFDGTVTKPPAPRPLDIYEISIEAGAVVVHLNRKVKRDKFEKKQAVYA